MSENYSIGSKTASKKAASELTTDWRSVLSHLGNTTHNIGAGIAAVGNKHIDRVENETEKPSDITSPVEEVTEEVTTETTEAPEAEKKNNNVSDQRLKEIFGDCGEDVVSIFGKINAIEYEYSDHAKELYPNGKAGVDDKTHIGVKAQELKDNPVTSSTVETDPETGYLQVDTRQLCLTNTAVISELCRRLDALESAMRFIRGN